MPACAQAHALGLIYNVCQEKGHQKGENVGNATANSGLENRT